MKTTNVVIAGNHQEYKTWLKLNNLDSDQYKYIRQESDFRGLSIESINYVGCFWENDVFKYSLPLLKAHSNQ